MPIIDVTAKKDIRTYCDRCGTCIELQKDKCSIELYTSDLRNPMTNDLMFKCLCEKCYKAQSLKAWVDEV